MILIENRPTVYLSHNKNLVTRVSTTDEFMKVKVNIETIKTTHKANVKGYSEVWFDEQAITKILTMKNVKHKFRVKYDRNNDGFFTDHNINGQDVQFNIHKGGPHYKKTKN